MTHYIFIHFEKLNALAHSMVGIFGFTIFAVFLFASIQFLLEREKRAFRRSLFLTLLLPLPFFLAFLLEIHFIELIISVFALTGLLVFLVPFRSPANITDAEPLKKYDERDTMFSRSELVLGSNRYINYYKQHPLPSWFKE